MKLGGWIGLVLVAVLLAACGAKTEEREHAHNGDLRETTESASQLPAFLEDKPESMRIVYEAAGRATDLLQWIPCYCGCGASAGHRSSLNCFVHEVRDDGSIVWDDHGTRCGVCLDIAAESINMMLEGKSVKDIRTEIDRKYESGYGAPTKTPMPA